jgi:hypothetical protein
VAYFKVLSQYFPDEDGKLTVPTGNETLIVHTERPIIVLIHKALKMEKVCFSETYVSTYESTRRQNSEHHHHHPRRRENPKSRKVRTCLRHQRISVLMVGTD